MKTAVIIGSNSDIAKSAAEYLIDQYHVIAIPRQVIDLADATSDVRLNMALTLAQADVVVNCAGVWGDNTIDYDLVFDVNVRSNWTVIQHYINNPPEKTVRFIMLGSSSYKQGRKNFILYAASKAALYNMWQGASEFCPPTLKLGLINPVRVNTKMVAGQPYKEGTLEAVDIAQKILELCDMTESVSVDMDYKKDEK